MVIKMKTLRKSMAVLMALAVSFCFFAASCDTKPTGDESSEFVQQYVTGTETGVTDGTAPALEYELESLVPALADPMARWGTPVLYRMHFRVRAKEYKCDFKYYKQ